MTKMTYDEAIAALAECYRLSGADTDGDEDKFLAPYAVEEVRRMRDEYDELLVGLYEPYYGD